MATLPPQPTGTPTADRQMWTRSFSSVETGRPPPGNQALDGGIVGLGLGALGAAVLGPTIQGALNGAQQSQGYSCGRRKRQANFGGSQTSGGGGGGGVQETDVDEMFFLPTVQGCTCNTNGRKRRQAPGEDEPGTRFFGGLFGGTPHCGN